MRLLYANRLAFSPPAKLPSSVFAAKEPGTAQIFLPYAITSNGQTLYEYIGQNTQLLLGGSDK